MKKIRLDQLIGPAPRTQPMAAIGLLLLGACAHTVPSAVAPAPERAPVTIAPATPDATMPTPPPAAGPATTEPGPTAVSAAPSAPTTVSSPAAVVTAPHVPVKTISKPVAAPAITSSTTAAAAPVAHATARPAAPPPLDLAALEQRLRDTRAIGVFTKLSIKNQVDDLLGRFRSHYRGGARTPVPALRQQYEMLFLKVLTVVQDGDPPLATAIATSREAIWSVLADPKRFAQI